MRIGLALLVVLVAAAPASADSRVGKLLATYKKEAAFCTKVATGIASAKERAEPYADQDAEIAADVVALGDAQVIVLDFCDAVDATIQLIRDNPKATYKQLAPRLEAHERQVREGRKATKQAIEDTDPVIQRLIPKVNKLRASS
jgi:hypothetical protein